MRLFFALLFVFALVFYGLWVWLPFWAFLLALVVGAVAGRAGVWELRQRAARMRRKALEGGHIELRSIAPAHMPGFVKGLDEEDEASDPRRYFWVEIEVEPPTLEGSWAPGRLDLAARGETGASPPEGEAVELCALSVAEGEEWREEEISEDVQGPARLRLHVGVLPGITGLEVGYAGESLGAIELPSGKD